MPDKETHSLRTRLRFAGIRHDELATRAGVARVTVTRELGGTLRLQARTVAAAEALLAERARDILRGCNEATVEAMACQ